MAMSLIEHDLFLWGILFPQVHKAYIRKRISWQLILVIWGECYGLEWGIIEFDSSMTSLFHSAADHRAFHLVPLGPLETFEFPNQLGAVPHFGLHCASCCWECQDLTTKYLLYICHSSCHFLSSNSLLLVIINNKYHYIKIERLINMLKVTQ